MRNWSKKAELQLAILQFWICVNLQFCKNDFRAEKQKCGCIFAFLHNDTKAKKQNCGMARCATDHFSPYFRNITTLNPVIVHLSYQRPIYGLMTLQFRIFAFWHFDKNTKLQNYKNTKMRNFDWFWFVFSQYWHPCYCSMVLFILRPIYEVAKVCFSQIRSSVFFPNFKNGTPRFWPLHTRTDHCDTTVPHPYRWTYGVRVLLASHVRSASQHWSMLLWKRLTCSQIYRQTRVNKSDTYFPNSHLPPFWWRLPL